MKDIIDAISTVGFPIVIAILLWFQQFKFFGAMIAHEEREADILEGMRTLLELLAHKAADPPSRG